jgi:hypothetical protein
MLAQEFCRRRSILILCFASKPRAAAQIMTAASVSGRNRHAQSLPRMVRVSQENLSRRDDRLRKINHAAILVRGRITSQGAGFDPHQFHFCSSALRTPDELALG